jgi:hypothetical protein
MTWHGSRTDSRLALPSGFREIRQSGACAQPHTAPSPKTASLLQRLSVSSFPFRHPLLYGSLLELRSLIGRIRCLWKQGDIRPIEIGLVYQQESAGSHLVRNRRSQARSRGIQQLLVACPWASSEDGRLFLAGWDAAEEWHKSLDSAENSECSQDSSAYPDGGNSMPLLAVPQSTKRDPLNPLPSRE